MNSKISLNQWNIKHFPQIPKPKPSLPRNPHNIHLLKQARHMNDNGSTQSRHIIRFLTELVQKQIVISHLLYQLVRIFGVTFVHQHCKAELCEPEFYGFGEEEIAQESVWVCAAD